VVNRKTDTIQTRWLVVLSVGMLLLIGLMLGIKVAPAPVVVVNPPATAEPIASAGDDQFFGGWVDSPEAREAVKASLPVGQRYFGETPAGKAAMGDERDVLLTEAAKAVLGKHLPIRNQGDVGSCVSFGTACAVEYCILVQIANANRAGLPPPTDFKDLAQEVIYGGSRVEVGKGQVRGDGSVTAWAAEFVKSWGVVARDNYPPYDLRTYSTKTCRQFGDKGCPSELEVVAKKSPVRGITFVRTADEAAKAIRQGYPIAVGSGVGFGNRGPWTRDKDGFLRASGSWGHCMAVVGVIGGARPGFLFVNSWGPEVHRGPTGGHDIPDGSFFVDWQTAGRMFGEGDAIAFSDAVGFPARRLPDFFIAVPKKSDVAARAVNDSPFALAP